MPFFASQMMLNIAQIGIESLGKGDPLKEASLESLFGLVVGIR